MYLPSQDRMGKVKRPIRSGSGIDGYHHFQDIGRKGPQHVRLQAMRPNLPRDVLKERKELGRMVRGRGGGQLPAHSPSPHEREDPEEHGIRIEMIAEHVIHRLSVY